MSDSTQNIYPGANKIFVELFDRIEQEGKIDENTLMLLYNSDQVDIFERFKLLRLISDENYQYTALLLKFLADNPFLIENQEIRAYMQDYFHHQVNRSSLLSDEKVMRLWRYHAYMISQGIAEFYPYIRHLVSRHGKVTAFSDSDVKIISHYSAVFAFDGYNADRIREVLRRAPVYLEQESEVFKQLKNKKENAYSKYAMALLYIMERAFKRKKFNSDKFKDMLSDIPRKYWGELYIDSLLNNAERLYCSFRRFYKNNGQKKVHHLTVSAEALPEPLN